LSRSTISILTALASMYCSAAVAECSLQEFGHHQTPPRLLGPHPVDNSYARFSYGSDASLDQNGFYIAWNFIKNEDVGNDKDKEKDGANSLLSRGLAVRWIKGGIEHFISNPLAPGEAACSWNSIGDTQPDPNQIDHDAPITYSSANQVQAAWVYAEKVTAGQGENSADRKPDVHETLLKRLYSRFSTSYLDAGGKTQQINIVLTSALLDNRLDVTVGGIVPGLTIAIANFFQSLGPVATDAKTQFKKLGYNVEDTSVDKFAGPAVARDIFGDNKDAWQLQFSFLSNTKGGDGKEEKPDTLFLALPANLKINQKGTMLLIFDGERRAIAADRIRLYELATP
jgi:hypothetical protein